MAVAHPHGEAAGRPAATWTRVAADRVREGITVERVKVLQHGARGALSSRWRRSWCGGLTEFDATFPAREARAVALERSAGVPVDEALAAPTGTATDGEILRWPTAPARPTAPRAEAAWSPS